MDQSRTQNSVKNMNFMFISYIIIVLLQFVNRTIFIKTLTNTYLGLDGLFSNVLSFLSLTELGVGSAFSYALYKPIANEDTELIKSLMRLYQKVYRIIGCAILILGCGVTPFLQYLIQDMPKDVPYIHFYYLLYVMNSGVSYFYTYKRSLIICNQKEYISTTTTTISKIILTLLQTLILVVLHSYAMYLFATIIVTIGENLVISIIANRLYPYLTENSVSALPKKVAADIKKKVSAMMFHKIGGAVVFSTDNLIISKFVGVFSVGIYSNYSLVVKAIDQSVKKILSSITASVGNLVISDDNKHVEQVLYRVLFFCFWVRGFCAISLLCLFQPFIFLWIGENYLLSFITVLIIAIDFYINGMRSAVLVFREASGIFQYDRYKPLIESGLNIILSIPLAIHYGVAGVLLGTIGSTLLVPFWLEAYVLFKYYFKKGIGEYMMKQVIYGAVTFLTGAGCYSLCELVSGTGILAFIVRSFICAILCNVVFIIFFCRTDEYKYFVEYLKNAVQKRKLKFQK